MSMMVRCDICGKIEPASVLRVSGWMKVSKDSVPDAMHICSARCAEAWNGNLVEQRTPDLPSIFVGRETGR